MMEEKMTPRRSAACIGICGRGLPSPRRVFGRAHALPPSPFFVKAPPRPEPRRRFSSSHKTRYAIFAGALYFTPSVTVSGLTTPPSCLRQATVSAAQGKRRFGQGMPRTMGHSQVRRRQRAHRALRKNAPAHPLHRGGYNKEPFPKITSARRVSLRCGTQFVPAGHTYHTWHLLSNKDKKGRGRYRCFKSTVSTPRREDFPKGKICGETQTVTPSVTLPTSMLDSAPPSRAVERSAFAAHPAFYNKATPSVSLRSTAPSGKEPRERKDFCVSKKICGENKKKSGG